MIPRVHVLLDEPQALATQLNAVARLLAAVTGQTVPDALQRVRYGRGIVARNLEAKPARELTRALASIGLGAFVVPVADFTPAPRARRVSGVAIDAAGLGLTLRGREGLPPRRLDWEDVWAIHPAAVVLESGSEERDALARKGEALASLEPRAKTLLTELRRHRERERAPVRLSIEVVCNGPRLFRLSSDSTGIYANLTQRGDHSLENFLRLLEELLTQAPKAVLVPPGAMRLVDRGEPDQVLFAKREALESFNAWLIQARLHDVSFGEDIDELDDEEMSDADEAIVVDTLVVGSVVGGAGEDEADEIDDLVDSGDEVDSRDELDDVEGDEGLEDDLDEEDDVEHSDELAALEEDEADDDVELDDEDLDGDLDEDLEDDAEADADVQEALEHMAEATGRLDLAAIEAMLTQSRDLEEDLDEEDVSVDAEVEEALGFFDPQSGRLDVQELLADDEER